MPDHVRPTLVPTTSTEEAPFERPPAARPLWTHRPPLAGPDSRWLLHLEVSGGGAWNHDIVLWGDGPDGIPCKVPPEAARDLAAALITGADLVEGYRTERCRRCGDAVEPVDVEGCIRCQIEIMFQRRREIRPVDDTPDPT